MSHSVEKLPNEPILLVSRSDDYNFTAEGVAATDEIFKSLDAQKELVFIIMDLSNVKGTLDEVIQAAARSTRERPFYKHPNAGEIVFVARSGLLKLAIKGMNSATFGHINLRVFDTRSEAFTYVRGKITAASIK